MGENCKKSVVRCGRCGRDLSDSEIRFLWSDIDWLEHHEHRVWIDRRDEPNYYATARSLVSADQVRLGEE